MSRSDQRRRWPHALSLDRCPALKIGPGWTRWRQAKCRKARRKESRMQEEEQEGWGVLLGDCSWWRSWDRLSLSGPLQHPSTPTHLPWAGIMLGQRRRRCPSIIPAHGQCVWRTDLYVHENQPPFNSGISVFGNPFKAIRFIRNN